MPESMTSRPRARKPHRCDDCGRTIPRGETYLRNFIVDGGECWTWIAHEDCAECGDEIAREWGDPYDLRGPLHDEEQETLDAMRGRYPHAVCRVELGRQLARGGDDA